MDGRLTQDGADAQGSEDNSLSKLHVDCIFLEDQKREYGAV